MTLALGIGATVAAFGCERCSLRPFWFQQFGQTLVIYLQRSDNPRTNFSLPEYCDYRDQNTSFDGLAAIASFNRVRPIRANRSGSKACRISANAFSISAYAR